MLGETATKSTNYEPYYTKPIHHMNICKRFCVKWFRQRAYMSRCGDLEIEPEPHLCIELLGKTATKSTKYEKNMRNRSIILAFAGVSV